MGGQCGQLIRVRLHETVDGGLDAAETEVETVLVEEGSLEWHAGGIAPGGQPVDHGAARIAQPHDLGHLVVGLAGGVVASLAHEFGGRERGDVVEGRVAAGDQQGHEGKSRRVRVKKSRMDVAFQMVDPHPGDTQAVSVALGKGKAHQQGAHQAGALGNGQGVEIRRLDAGFGLGFEDHRQDHFDVLARGQFRDHAAVAVMDLHLGGHHR